MCWNVYQLHQVCVRKTSKQFKIIEIALFRPRIGPGTYTVANSTLNQTKAYSFGTRPEQKVRSDTPAPNQYAAEKCNFSRQPSFTFGGRRKVDKPDATPGITFLVYK